ncbi:MAG: hypothetical protein ACP5VR_00500, partial [Acidimicrobiales bacterium]
SPGSSPASSGQRWSPECPDDRLHAGADRQVPRPPGGVKPTLRDAATVGDGRAAGSLRSPRPPGSVSSLFGA